MLYSLSIPPTQAGAFAVDSSIDAGPFRRDTIGVFSPVCCWRRRAFRRARRKLRPSLFPAVVFRCGLRPCRCVCSAAVRLAAPWRPGSFAVPPPRRSWAAAGADALFPASAFLDRGSFLVVPRRGVWMGKRAPRGVSLAASPGTGENTPPKKTKVPVLSGPGRGGPARFVKNPRLLSGARPVLARGSAPAQMSSKR